MKEFALLFRQPSFDYSNASPTEMQAIGKKWHDWAGAIAAQGRLVNNGIRLATEGKVLKAGGVITDGPFVEIREMLGSFIVIKADSLEEAPPWHMVARRLMQMAALKSGRSMDNGRVR